MSALNIAPDRGSKGMRVELQELAELTESLDSRMLPSLSLNVSFGMYLSTGPAKLT